MENNPFANIKVSAIIPTYNRFQHLTQAIESINNQTHKNIEIIVVNDGSTDKRYYTHRFDGITWIDTDTNTETLFGFPCPGYVRNIGIKKATGSYIAFLDDDDIWLPHKTWTQLSTMATHNCEMSCTEGLMGDYLYSENKSYPKYNAEYYKGYYDSFFQTHYGLSSAELPTIFDLELMSKHNCIITSSVLVKRTLIERSGLFQELPVGLEDWDLWKRCLEHTSCLYLRDPLVYYDGRLSERRKILPKITNCLRRIKRQIWQTWGRLSQKSIPTTLSLFSEHLITAFRTTHC